MKKKILIVEDEKQLLTALTLSFEDEGFEVLQAQDGIEGIAIAKKHKPDFIITDIAMPNMGGLEMIHEIRELDSWGKKVGILILTNYDQVEKVSDALSTGVFNYFVKSDLVLDEVIKEVHSALGSKS